MNYRHAFHAGNFADVVKHATLCRVLVHLRAKPTAFRVIDLHAGAGLYDLAGPQAERGGEWHDGIERLRAARLGAEAASLLAPYLETIVRFNPGTALAHYPGSPLIAQALLRSQDRLVACELEPNEAAALARHLARDYRVKALSLDGWIALRAQVPPKERRGLVLIDPPFERADEFEHLAEAVTAAHRKWATGILLIWYPIKDRSGPELLEKKLRRAGVAKLLRAELAVDGGRDPARLSRCGLIVVNPPWLLHAELAVLLPALAACLSSTPDGASFRLDWLGREN